MKKVSWLVVLAGAAVGVAAVALTMLGNPSNMGFCIACFLRDIAGACGLHSAAKVQYVRPEIIGLVLGAFIMSVATREFKAKAGSSPVDALCSGRLCHDRRAGLPGLPAAHDDKARRGRPQRARGGSAALRWASASASFS